MKKVVSIVFLGLIFVGTLILASLTTAIRPNLVADCKIHSPWWTSQTQVWAKVTWGTRLHLGLRIFHIRIR